MTPLREVRCDFWEPRVELSWARIRFGRCRDDEGKMQLAWVARQWIEGLVGRVWRWRPGTVRLGELIQAVREGQAPLESLDQVTGRLGPLALQVRDVLADLKHCKAELAREEQNLKYRLAQRTDALERLVGSLRMQANRDALTGLFNRRMFDQHLPALVQRSLEQGRRLCVLAMDVDHFKLLNDTLGHQAGDLFLRDMGQIIRSAIREDDMAFRIGGDEFVVAMPEYSVDGGIVLAGRLTRLIDSMGSVYRLEERLGISVGWAALGTETGSTWEELLDAADRSLYQCKARRRGVGAACAAR